MMVKIEPPFQIGDTVYVPVVSREPKPLKCPECNGTKKVKLVFHDGTEEEINCNACRYGFEYRGYIEYFDFTPRVQRMTVGAVKYDSTNNEDRGPWEFMCVETGIGSGQLHYATDMFTTHEQAMERAIEKADRQRQHVDEHNIKQRSQKRGDFHRKEEYIREQAMKARIRELESALAEARKTAA